MSKLAILLFSIIVFPQFGSSQDSLTFVMSYEVNKIYPINPISKEELKTSKVLVDLNQNFKTSWVKEYVDVEITTWIEGVEIKTKSKNDSLSQQQVENMVMSDFGTNIGVKVRYMPDNTLSHNDVQEERFIVSPIPKYDATYPGGQHGLEQYIKNNLVDRIPNSDLMQYKMSAVKFIIDKVGHVVDAHVFISSNDERTDHLLLETICNMPAWAPARYSNGTEVKQEFALTVGDMESCMINKLNLGKGVNSKKEDIQ